MTLEPAFYATVAQIVPAFIIAVFLEFRRFAPRGNPRRRGAATFQLFAAILALLLAEGMSLAVVGTGRPTLLATHLTITCLGVGAWLLLLPVSRSLREIGHQWRREIAAGPADVRFAHAQVRAFDLVALVVPFLPLAAALYVDVRYVW
ncbi:MAG TPA: hypothetical protein VGL93_30845 [Streptosporangiaceae bacterium]|jgi:hypothetical protein